MRKKLKYLFSTVIALFLCISATSCSNDGNKRKELSEKKIKENFNKEVKKFSLSKDTLNGMMQSVEESFTNEVDIDSLIDSINIANTKASITQTVAEELIQSTDAYAWQKEDKIFVGNVQDDEPNVYLLDLGLIKETISTSREDVLPDVDLDESSIDSESFDEFLSKIKFTVDDFEFDYESKIFTFSKEILVDKLYEILEINNEQAKEVLSYYLGEFDFKIGYDGYNFKEYKLLFKPNLGKLIESFYPMLYANFDIDMDLKLDHDLKDNVIGYDLYLNLNYSYVDNWITDSVPYAINLYNSIKLDINSTQEKVEASIYYKNKTISKGGYFPPDQPILIVEKETNILEVNCSFVQDKVNNTFEEEGSISQELIYKVDDSSTKEKVVHGFSVSYSDSNLNISLKTNEKEVISLKVNKKDEALSAEFTYSSYGEDESLNEVMKVVITNENVTIPSSLMDQETNAIDLTQEIFDSLGNIEIDL